MRYKKEHTESILCLYLLLSALLALLALPRYVLADEPPSIPANIHGTVTVNGIPVSGSAYTVSGGGVQDVLDENGEYLLTIPGGGSGYLSVFKNGRALTVLNGQFSVGQGETVQIDLRALDIPIIFTATPSSITEGEFTTLSWTISNATYVSIDKGIGSINPQSGSIEVSPYSTITYVLTAGNAAGSVTSSVRVTVVAPVEPETYSYYIPYYRGDDLYTTALALRNSSDTQVATVTVTIYDQDGTIIESELLPVSELSPSGQYAYNLRRDLQMEGWVQIDSDQKLTGFSWTAKVSEVTQRMINMADITLIPELSTTLIVPHVAQSKNWDTTIYICNPNGSRTTVTLDYVDQSGDVLYTKDYSIPANGSGVYELLDLLDGDEAPNGSVKITATNGVAAFALFYDTEKRADGSCYAGVNAVDPAK